MVPAPLRDSVRRRFGPFAPWEAGYRDVTAPAFAGEVVGPPDFVGIGAQKCGTSWWFELMVSHPGLFHHDEVHKELHFFARFALDSFGPTDVERYHSWFSRPAGLLTGEWTPDYFVQPWVPALLALAAPDARLVVILRDPVERFVSGVTHSDIELSTHLGLVLSDGFRQGMYASSLVHWLGHFSKERILVLQYERCLADPIGQITRTYRFLGVDHRFRPPALERRVSPTTRPKTHLSRSARDRLAELYAQEVKQTMALVPDLDLDLWPNFSESAKR